MAPKNAVFQLFLLKLMIPTGAHRPGGIHTSTNFWSSRCYGYGEAKVPLREHPESQVANSRHDDVLTTHDPPKDLGV